MEGHAAALERGFLTWCLQQSGVSLQKLTTLLPDFLIISPPKTGSTWLTANLRCHPQVFMPAIKEVRYFSSFYKWLDLNWYLDHFAAGARRVKGEASPSYALLPVERIRLVRRLMPEVKLIFLMRDPVARAWSHAKHNYRYREANFTGYPTNLEAVPESQWQANFNHDWPLASGDYLGQLRRWLAVFPREQVFVGFYESLASRGEDLLRTIFGFLGVDADVDLATFPVKERILPGLEGQPSPALERCLQQLLHERTLELTTFLRERLGLEVPTPWQRTLQPAAPSRRAAAFRAEFDDAYLCRVLELEERFISAWRPVQEDYRGYNLICLRGQLCALDRSLDPVRFAAMDEAQIKRYQAADKCFIAPGLAEVKELVDEHVFCRAQLESKRLESLLAQSRADIARLQRALGEVVAMRLTWRRAPRFLLGLLCGSCRRGYASLREMLKLTLVRQPLQPEGPPPQPQASADGQ
jgi:hypothetical protein